MLTADASDEEKIQLRAIQRNLSTDLNQIKWNNGNTCEKLLKNVIITSHGNSIRNGGAKLLVKSSSSMLSHFTGSLLSMMLLRCFCLFRDIRLLFFFSFLLFLAMILMKI